MRKFILATLVMLGLGTASLANAVPGTWTVQDYRADSGMVMFLYELNDYDVLTLTVNYPNRTLTAALTDDGVVYTGDQLKRLVQFDEMGRMDSEIVFTPSEFNFSDFVEFFTVPGKFNINWEETGFKENIPINSDAAAVFLPYYKDLNTFHYVY